MTAWLSEALHLDGQIDKAQEVACEGITLSQEVRFWYGVGLAQRVLGRIVQSSGNFPEAASLLHEALQTFATIQSRFEVGRTYLDLASVAHAQGNREAAATHLHEAHALFIALRVPVYRESSTQLANAFGVPLAIPSHRSA